jgi:hypothetical protein
MQDDILACDNFGDCYLLITQKPLEFDRKTLLRNMKQGVSNQEIRELRRKFKGETIGLLKESFDKNLE